MKLNLTDNRKAILSTLRSATAPLTLAEISALVGFEVKTGSTNALVKAGAIKVAGERTIVCPACGRKHTVKEYVIGDTAIAD